MNTEEQSKACSEEHITERLIHLSDQAVAISVDLMNMAKAIKEKYLGRCSDGAVPQPQDTSAGMIPDTAHCLLQIRDNMEQALAALIALDFTERDIV